LLAHATPHDVSAALYLLQADMMARAARPVAQVDVTLRGAGRDDDPPVQVVAQGFEGGDEGRRVTSARDDGTRQGGVGMA